MKPAEKTEGQCLFPQVLPQPITVSILELYQAELGASLGPKPCGDSHTYPQHQLFAFHTAKVELECAHPQLADCQTQTSYSIIGHSEHLGSC